MRYFAAVFAELRLIWLKTFLLEVLNKRVYKVDLSQIGEMVSRLAHNQEKGGSIPPSAIITI